MATQKENAAVVQAASEESKRIVALLERLVHLSKRSMRSIESEIGLSQSVLGKVFNGTIRPQLIYVLLVAGAIGLAPEDFFALAYRSMRRRPSHPLVRDLLETERRSDTDEKIELTRGELDRLVKQSVKEELQRLISGSALNGTED